MTRYHLSFVYPNPTWHSMLSSGDAAVMAGSLEEAVILIARDRDLKGSIHIRKRFFYGKPASEAEIIDQTFERSRP